MEIIRTPDLLSSGQPLLDRLTNELSEHSRVLWLVSGGSNIALAAQVMAALPENLTPNLTVMLTDERYGLWDHPDSNFRQLHDAGFNPKQGTFLPTLTHANASLEATVSAWSQTVVGQFTHADRIIGHFGMGKDGHTAGILPGSPAITANGMVTGYETELFTRITLTFEAIEQINALYLYAYGADKREALENLRSDIALDQQPAQIIKQVSESYVYNDQIGELL